MGADLAFTSAVEESIQTKCVGIHAVHLNDIRGASITVFFFFDVPPLTLFEIIVHVC